MAEHRHFEGDHGALVGWRSEDLGTRLVLKLESVTTPPPHGPDDVRTFLYLLDKQQAIQLATDLFRMAEAAPPRRRPRWFRR